MTLEDMKNLEDLKKENRELRLLLWIRHSSGDCLLYGDDSEMQCNTCMLDFRRDDPSFIRDRFIANNLKKADVVNAQKKLEALATTINTAELTDAIKEKESLQTTLNMYANAWRREIGAPYANKRHNIDDLVMTTKLRITERDLARSHKELLQNSLFLILEALKAPGRPSDDVINGAADVLDRVHCSHCNGTGTKFKNYDRCYKCLP